MNVPSYADIKGKVKKIPTFCGHHPWKTPNYAVHGNYLRRTHSSGARAPRLARQIRLRTPQK